MKKYRTVIILALIAFIIIIVGFLGLRGLDLIYELIFGPFENPIKENNGTNDKKPGSSDLKYSMTWDFNNGDLSGLTVNKDPQGRCVEV